MSVASAAVRPGLRVAREPLVWAAPCANCETVLETLDQAGRPWCTLRSVSNLTGSRQPSCVDWLHEFRHKLVGRNDLDRWGYQYGKRLERDLSRVVTLRFSKQTESVSAVAESAAMRLPARYVTVLLGRGAAAHGCSTSIA